MRNTLRAIRLFKTENSQDVRMVDLTDADLMEGDVDIRIDHSTLNYKDALAVMGRAPIVRVWPLTPGIDLAGIIERSDNSGFQIGDRVVLNGWGIGETHHGGFSQKARVKGDWLIKLPIEISTLRAMAIGTAGYTAMLCVMALERNGIAPGRGDIVVTGATGGVGSVSIALLSRLGYGVIAVTGRLHNEIEYLKSLGVLDVIDRSELADPSRTLGKERWAGAIDTVGSHTLANVLAQIRYGGVVAACGMAQGLNLPASMAPFILRNVTLAGVDSVKCSLSLRREAWRRLANDLDFSLLDSMTSHITLDEVPDAARDLLDGKMRGRLVVDVNV